MQYIRPIQMEDMERLLYFAETSLSGFTTLPNDRELLEDKVIASLEAFKSAEPSQDGDRYLFALYDSGSDQIIGISGIISKVSLEPFYAYRIEEQWNRCITLGIEKHLTILFPTITKERASEICTLFLDQNYRRGALGRLLSFSRFVFMASQPKLFKDKTIAELRGVFDENDHSPFWEAVGKHFYNLDFETADMLSAEDKQFIQDLLPRQPIYADVLPKDAQKAIGAVHQQGIGAMKLLEKEGFRYAKEVDIFDGGPKVYAQTEKIRTIKNSQTAIVDAISEIPETEERTILSNGEMDFRACYGAMELSESGGIIIRPDVAEILKVDVGTVVRYVST